jgi:hypothetical protein
MGGSSRSPLPLTSVLAMSYIITCKAKKTRKQLIFFHKSISWVSFLKFLPLSGCFNNKQLGRGVVEVGIMGRDWSLVLSRAGEEEIVGCGEDAL